MSDIQIRVYRFHPDRLDPVRVYVEQTSERSGRMTVQCYTKAWTAYWGNMGNCSLEKFVFGCNNCYVVDYLIGGWEHALRKPNVKHEREYLMRIVDAIKAEFVQNNLAQ